MIELSKPQVAVLTFSVTLGVVHFLSFAPIPTPGHYGDAIVTYERHYYKRDEPRLTGSYGTVAEPIAAPVVTGLPMKLFNLFLRVPVIGSAFARHLKRDNGYGKLRSFASGLPQMDAMFQPYSADRDAVDGSHVAALAAAKAAKPDSLAMSSAALRKGPLPGTKPGLSRAMHAAFLEGRLSPVKVVEETLEKIRASDNDHEIALRAITGVRSATDLRAEAEKSARRYEDKKPLSLLDGVPFLVKTELAVEGLQHSLGTAVYRSRIAEHDEEPVRKLRAAGAIVIGVTNMHEIGLGTTGFNAHYGSPRNPANREYHTGGSSSGSAAAVAAGIVPFAVGADGGGSIRIPASLCGVSGLKGTYGRVLSGSEIEFSLGYVGPIGATIDDNAIAFDLMAATPDEARDAAFPQPALFAPTPMTNALDENVQKTPKLPLHGLKVGHFPAYTAIASEPNQRATEEAIEQLRALGATIVDVEIPFLDVGFAAHTVTILSEMSTAIDRFRRDFEELSYPAKSTLAIAATLSSEDYVAAQLTRRWFHDYHRRVVFNRTRTAGGCDVFITPNSAIPAPRVPKDEEGEVNLQDTASIMRYMYMGNLLGNPGIVVPVSRTTAEDKARFGYGENLPLGVQLQADHWQEALLLRVAGILEQGLSAKKSP